MIAPIPANANTPVPATNIPERETTITRLVPTLLSIAPPMKAPRPETMLAATPNRITPVWLKPNATDPRIAPKVNTPARPSR